MADLDKKITDAIMAFDRDGDGMLNENEALMIVKACGMPLSVEDEEAITKKFNANGGLIKPEVVKKVVTDCVGGKDVKAQLMSQFKRFDRSNDGTIKVRELQEILRTIGECLTEPEQQGLCKLCAKGPVIHYKELIDTLMDL
eukprot:Protomagalhaensia_sp_Gyna_25__3597@NODE_3232_length_668_cov_36_826709_g2708_i0_p1_GENE_NODE_3232_length_668_cov_36_826709_g2708_i0NODE_3232_length_668_cov_36_826709_g2708_i0_p1_ORF_typecomplete_len142_score29_56EFhand_7/PF13499_6/0_0055EFhand_7/PF13499_6/3_4e06EFhand_6/PF13405_6/0_071EFhand_6/PF13405_6/2_9e05EFhand_6/PF13405_6/1_2e03EFhand_1/PF00036_32/0_015EFhand_1/PF00036_32/0_0053EFhand_1/PF00036_32/7_5e03EFhand_8/PF13833_6/0_0085EFhand_8/PF13833_6/1_2e03EFhand_8/PF13833_6/0_3EFhand_8/PF13833